VLLSMLFKIVTRTNIGKIHALEFWERPTMHTYNVFYDVKRVIILSSLRQTHLCIHQRCFSTVFVTFVVIFFDWKLFPAHVPSHLFHIIFTFQTFQH
jgi:hypothetical protein